jgi:hypothetical protein
LKAVLFDDTDDTPNADRKSGLAEFLRDDLDRGVGIEKAVADDLANELVGADIVAFGSRLVAPESLATMFTITLKQLKVSLFTKVELFGGLGGTEPFALAFDEHAQAFDDEVIRTNREFTGGADDASGGDVDLHSTVLQQKGWVRWSGLLSGHPGKNSMDGPFGLIDCGVLLRL